jgi:hypothetical protein
MAPGEASAAFLRRLRAEIRADRATLRVRSGDIRRFAQADDGILTPERTAALALALDRTYTILEAILERTARTLEGGLPAGEDWHLRLLVTAHLDIEGVRPRILDEVGLAAANELRGFRHFLRHAYAAELDPVRVGEIARDWLRDLPAVERNLDRFESFLEDLVNRL